MNTWGNKLKITIFGESHGMAVGAVIDGLAPGTKIDMEYIGRELARRAPGQSVYSTTRKESDEPHILSGVKDGYATGAPIACAIYNENTRSSDYGSELRPGHADWTGMVKYGAHFDRSGGGRFSGRLTAPLVFAGAVAKGALAEKGVRIYGRICCLSGVRDNIDLTGEDSAYGDSAIKTEGLLKGISGKAFPAANEYEEGFKSAIVEAKREGDSVGGEVEIAVFGVPAGLGEPFFSSVESTLASLYFSVPAVKGVEFGKGFAISAMMGSEANDPLLIHEGGIVSETNNNGGILGGIANGMPIVARVAVKPTSSIAKVQRSVDLHNGGAMDNLTETEFRVRGRHDPSIVPRAVPVIEAVTAIGLLDLYYMQ
jgi:chorismate synthase